MTTLRIAFLPGTQIPPCPEARTCRDFTCSPGL
jgi:hypothetical protein